MVLFTIQWRTHRDERTCPVCFPLHDYQWVFDTELDSFPKELHHPQQGKVWDAVLDEPFTHGIGSRKGPWNCRCELFWRFDTESLTQKGREVRREVSLMVGTLEHWARFGYVRVLRDSGGRFVTWTQVL